MKVCIAEKPSVAREIAQVIGASTRHDGYYEGNGYQVTWTFGHLCSLKEPNDYNPVLKRWHMGHLPIIPARHGIKLMTNRGVDKQFKTIEKLVQNAEEVINCGDAGQEGEVIQRWVLHKAKCVAPIKRLWISSLTEQAIREGFTKLRDGSEFDLLYAAGSSRAIGDWLLGINATRLYTLKYGQFKQTLSVGRVQTPTLALIVNRQLEIDNFKSEKFWELKTIYRETTFAARIERIVNQEQADNELEKVVGKPLTIISVGIKEGKEYAPRLFDLTSLQVECNKKFGFSADETLTYVQNLYEQKFVTYPRVDTTYLPDDLYPKVPDTLRGLTAYSKFTSVLLDKPIRKTNKVFDDKKVTDHHAIIPTGVMPGGIGQPQKKVFDQIARRFIAAFYPDCEVSNTTVDAKVEETDFRATGKQILDPGWRVVMGSPTKEELEKEGDTEQVLPAFDEGESGEHEPRLEAKETKPPRPYTEATLLRAMESAGKQVDDDELRELMKDNGIGRPSTRANIIETLFRRNYVVKERKNLIPTATGRDLILTIQNELLKSAELTGQWERKLRLIEKGEYEVEQFMTEMKEMVTNLVYEVKMEQGMRIAVVNPEAEKAAAKAAKKAARATKSKADLSCPKCTEGNLLKGKSAWGCSRWKEGCDFRLNFEAFGKKLTDAQVRTLVTKKKTGKIKGLIIGGKTTEGIIRLSDSFSVEVQSASAGTLTCPKCKAGNILSGKSAWGCSNFKSGCDFRLPFELSGKTISKSHMEQLISKGKTRKIKGFVKTGTNESFDAVLALNADFVPVFGK